MFLIPSLSSLHHPALQNALQAKLNNKTKPLGSLGKLETLALQLGLILGTAEPQLVAPQMLVCAADHGLAAHGVSAYPSDVTWQMVNNFLTGGAAVSVLAKLHHIALTIVDCGVRQSFAPQPNLVLRSLGAGTADALAGPAMTQDQCDNALRNGAELVQALPGNVVLLGEMGIGNTSAAALLLARLAQLDIADCTGPGTGLSPEGVTRKIGILRQVLQKHANATAPLDALAAFGGFEIATLVGAALEAAAQRRIIVVDGFITTAAIMVAAALQPLVLECCVFAHRSNEQGHRLMLAHLQAEPLLDLGLRLGEGSGAALAWPLLQAACAILNDMASFEGAGISRQSPASNAQPSLAPDAQPSPSASA